LPPLDRFQLVLALALHIAPAEAHLPMLSPSTMARGCKPASMPGWTWAMWGRVSIGGVLVVCFLVPGCWSSEPQVDGAFSQEEWTFLQTFKLPEPDLCPVGRTCWPS